MGFVRGSMVSLMAIGGLVVASWAYGAVPRVSDEGKFFSADAITKANQKIKDIQRVYRKDLLIETVPSVPTALERRFKELGAKDFFIEWTRRRAEEAGVKGIYILISKKPGHLQIEVDQQTRNQGFGLDDRDALAKKMVALFGQKNNDGALLEAVGFVETKLAVKLGKRPAAPAPVAAQKPVKQPVHRAAEVAGHGAEPDRGISPLGWIGITVAALLGVWLLAAVFRAVSGIGRGGGVGGPMGPGGAGGYGGGGGGGGGGGFFSSLMGGLFGAAAGMWLYNSMFGGESHWGSPTAFGGESSRNDLESGAGDFSGDSSTGADFDTDDSNAADDSGGDYGGGSFGDSGGDFGGGDFGGGDFGGGDFGGGGDA